MRVNHPFGSSLLEHAADYRGNTTTTNGIWPLSCIFTFLYLHVYVGRLESETTHHSFIHSSLEMYHSVSLYTIIINFLCSVKLHVIALNSKTATNIMVALVSYRLQAVVKSRNKNL